MKRLWNTLGAFKTMLTKNGKKLGRPRTADERNRRQDGNPILHVRLAGDVFDTVKSLGGVAWVRELILRELATGDE